MNITIKLLFLTPKASSSVLECKNKKIVSRAECWEVCQASKWPMTMMQNHSGPKYKAVSIT